MGNIITKYIDVDPRLLFEVQYTTQKKNIFFTYYVPTAVVGKEYHPDIDLVTWDIQNNGFAWRYVVSEIDDQETTTRSEIATAEYATNFSVSYQKIGLNFGASAKKTQSITYTSSIARNSDDLGTLEAKFSDPVILSTSNNSCTLYSMSNGLVEMTVIPVRGY